MHLTRLSSPARHVLCQVARELGGPLLSVWVVMAAALSNVGLFLAEMNSDAYLLMGMAECGLLPSFLAMQSCYHTPLRAIVLSAGLIAGLSVTCTFDELITMINWLYAIAEVGHQAWHKLHMRGRACAKVGIDG